MTKEFDNLCDRVEGWEYKEVGTLACPGDQDHDLTIYEHKKTKKQIQVCRKCGYSQEN
jgi:hypothetical protein